MSGAADILVVGGGIVGLSLAVHAARRDLAVVLVEAGELGGESTQRSGALLRAHYADQPSAVLARRGVEIFARFEQEFGGPCGFVETGFAYVPEESELASGELAARLEMLTRVGVETWWAEAAEIAAIAPALAVDDAGGAVYEPRAGFADPATTTATLAAAAREEGATLRAGAEVAALLDDADGAVCGVRLTDGETVEAGKVVLCAGAHSATLAAAAEVELPLRPTAVKLAFFERAVSTHPIVIDAPGGIYLRPLEPGATLVGRRTWTDEPLEGPDAPLPEVDEAFAAAAGAALARRLPSAAGARRIGGRAGMLDMTPDGLPLVGPSPAPGLWLCCGWSGTGFKTAPAVGEALAEWLGGAAPAPELDAFDPGRAQLETEALRSPH